MVAWWLVEAAGSSTGLGADPVFSGTRYLEARKFAQFRINEHIERYTTRINMILRHTPFDVVIECYENPQKGLELRSEWIPSPELTSSGASLWRIETVHKTHPNILVDIEVTLSNFLEQAYDIITICSSTSLNEYLIHPQIHLRNIAKLIYEINHGNHSNA